MSTQKLPDDFLLDEVNEALDIFKLLEEGLRREAMRLAILGHPPFFCEPPALFPEPPDWQSWKAS